jgi:cellulose synthase/poly-beta-1,6-N-acetylglucosamine synthase-like glycosyltransferase
MTAALLLADGLAGLGALILAVLAANHLRLLAAGRRLWPRLLAEPPAPAPSGAEILVQIPVYNEPAAVAGAVASAAALDWPRDRLTVQILDDSDDGSSLLASAAAEAAERRGVAVDHCRRGTRAGFKAGALAAGLERSAAPYVALLDADFRPAPDFLRHAVAAIETDPAIGFVQLRFEVANRRQSALTRGQALLADAHFLVEQAGRAATGEWLQFNGTAGLWRRAAIEDAGGWRGDTLAEDLDLALRAQARGWRAALLLCPPVPCEAPAEAAAWRVQQARWSTGFVEVATRLLPRLAAEKPSVALMLGLQAALPAVLAVILGLGADLALRGPSPAHAAVAAGAAAAGLAVLVAVTLPPFRALGRGSLADYGRDLLALPLMLVGLAVAHGGTVLAAPLARPRVFVRTPKAGRGSLPE